MTAFNNSNKKHNEKSKVKAELKLMEIKIPEQNFLMATEY